MRRQTYKAEGQDQNEKKIPCTTKKEEERMPGLCNHEPLKGRSRQYKLMKDKTRQRETQKWKDDK
jgi:hypothetical protein